MEHRKQHLPLIAGALLAFGSGCITTDAKKAATEAPKKADVTQPGVLPPPQELMRPAAPSAVAPAAGPVVQAGAKGIPAPIAADIPITKPGTAAAAMAATPFKLPGASDRKVAATNMAVAWRNRIEYLPDPSRNGATGAGLAGQLFLYGGPKLEFAQADGTLTIDLVDDTPRAPGQPAATPERWQFDKHTLRKLQTNDETFGRSYVLFLPWPAYKPDITKVRISARYDPDGGHPLFQAPATVTIDTSVPGIGPKWEERTSTVGPTAPQPLPPQPIVPGVTPLGPLAPAAGLAPGATHDGLPPIAITGGR